MPVSEQPFFPDGFTDRTSRQVQNMHVHACAHARMCTRTNTHASVHMCVRAHTHTHIPTQAYMQACTHTSKHARMHAYTRMHACMHAHTRTHPHTPTCLLHMCMADPAHSRDFYRAGGLPARALQGVCACVTCLVAYCSACLCACVRACVHACVRTCLLAYMLCACLRVCEQCMPIRARARACVRACVHACVRVHEQGFKRLTPSGLVRLRYAYVLTCHYGFVLCLIDSLMFYNKYDGSECWAIL